MRVWVCCRGRQRGVKPGARREASPAPSSADLTCEGKRVCLFLRLGTRGEGVLSEGCGVEGSSLVCRQRVVLGECSLLAELQVAGNQGLAFRRPAWQEGSLEPVPPAGRALGMPSGIAGVWLGDVFTRCRRERRFA